MKPRDAIDFHSEIAETFSDGYALRRNPQARLQLWSSLIAEFSVETGRALDVGCGPGHLSAVAAAYSAEVVAIDGSGAMLQRAKEVLADEGLSNVTLVETDISDLDALPLGRFDLIICSSVLEYLPNARRTLESFMAKAKPGAVLILSVPDSATPYRRLEGLAYKWVGRPRYRAFVQSIEPASSVGDELVAAGWVLLRRLDVRVTLPILSRIPLTCLRPVASTVFVARAPGR
jgi:2-polyprenyl-6-hydroxyphenyl methylase/3-demethylubiquinone-9 3-methyltransferase